MFVPQDFDLECDNCGSEFVDDKSTEGKCLTLGSKCPLCGKGKLCGLKGDETLSRCRKSK